MSTLKFTDNTPTYLENPDSGKHIGITFLLRYIPKAKGSHAASWAYMWAAQLRNKGNTVKIIDKDDDWDQFDKIYILQESFEEDFSPNVFGGLSDLHVSFLKNLIEIRPEKFVALDIPMINYAKFLDYRLSRPNAPESGKQYDWSNLEQICRNIPVLTQKALKEKHLIMGDSHSLSMYVQNSMVDRKDGKTLHGALDIGLLNVIKQYGDPVDLVTIYYGNIDIRHHFCRLNGGDYEKNVSDIMAEFEKQLNSIIDAGYKIELVEALPIEKESRKIPNSIGRYKGQPFHGDWKTRSDCSKLFNEHLQEIASRHPESIRVYTHPAEYTNEYGELSFSVMEPKQNVHLSREFYRWNFDTNQPRTNFASNV